MKNEQFEKLWQKNRTKLLANDEEYRKISKSYTNWGWADYLVLIAGFVICDNFTKSLAINNIWQYVITLFGMFIVWMGFRLMKSRLGGKKTLDEVEMRIKEQYRNSLQE